MPKHKCPVCGKYEFSREDSYEICPFCQWEDEQLGIDEPDERSGPNPMTLNQARVAWKQGLNILGERAKMRQ